MKTSENKEMVHGIRVYDNHIREITPGKTMRKDLEVFINKTGLKFGDLLKYLMYIRIDEDNNLYLNGEVNHDEKIVLIKDSVNNIVATSYQLVIPPEHSNNEWVILEDINQLGQLQQHLTLLDDTIYIDIDKQTTEPKIGGIQYDSRIIERFRKI